MGIIFILSGVVFILILIDTLVNCDVDTFAIKIISLLFIFICFIFSGFHAGEPTAMDVYEGKTKITYKGYYYNDSIFIKTDSIVEFTTRYN